LGDAVREGEWKDSLRTQAFLEHVKNPEIEEGLLGKGGYALSVSGKISGKRYNQEL